MDAEVATEVRSEDETFFGSDIDVDSEAESQPSSPAVMWLKVADDSTESEDEESSPEMNSESGASGTATSCLQLRIKKWKTRLRNDSTQDAAANMSIISPHSSAILCHYSCILHYFKSNQAAHPPSNADYSLYTYIVYIHCTSLEYILYNMYRL